MAETDALITHVFVRLPVTNYAPARTWYEQFFGRPPGVVPKAGEAVWQVTTTGLTGFEGLLPDGGVVRRWFRLSLDRDPGPELFVWPPSIAALDAMAPVLELLDAN